MNAIMRRLESGERWWAAEVALRAFGLVLLALCTAGTIWLYGSVHLPPAHEANAKELLAGFIAVGGWCLGWSFLVVGPGLFKLVPDPRRRDYTISMRGISR
jgi:hypothetical protein